MQFDPSKCQVLQITNRQTLKHQVHFTVHNIELESVSAAKYLGATIADQRRIDSRLMMIYKVTYGLVAIPASLYLVRSTRASRHIHSLAYRQILTLKDYYRFTFFPKTIIYWNTFTANIPTLPTLAQFSSAVGQVIHVST